MTASSGINRMASDTVFAAGQAGHSGGQAVSSLPPSRINSFNARVLNGLDDPFLLHAERQNRNIFLDSRFLAAIRDNMLGKADRLTLIGVTGPDDSPVALFPFVLRRKWGVHVLEGMDFGITDYFAPALLCETALTGEETESMWRAVLGAAPHAHAISFKKMPRILHGKPHALTGAGFVVPMGASATTLPLSQPDGSKFRIDKVSVAREVRRKSKKLEQSGEVRFSEATTPEEVDSAFDTLMAFRKARFGDLGRRDALLDPRVVSFYRELAHRGGSERPAGRLLTLTVGGQPVAVVYGFSCGDVLTLIAPAITTCRQIQAGSPGLIVIYRALQWCSEQGYAIFDLSVGSLFYKSRFGAEAAELFEYHKALSLLGLPVVVTAHLRHQARLMTLGRPRLRSALERLARFGHGLARNNR